MTLPVSHKTTKSVIKSFGNGTTDAWTPTLASFLAFGEIGEPWLGYYFQGYIWLHLVTTRLTFSSVFKRKVSLPFGEIGELWLGYYIQGYIW